MLALVLFVKGIQAERGAHIVGGFFVCVLVAGGDMKGFAVPVQAGIASVMVGMWRGKLRKAWLAGLAICVGAGGLYLLALFATGQLGLLAGNGLVSSQTTIYTESQRLARDVTDFNQDALGHFLRLASNADYGLIWTNATLPGYSIKQWLGQIQAFGLNVLIGMGMLLWGLRRGRGAVHGTCKVG